MSTEEKHIFEWEPGKELNTAKAAVSKEKLQEIFSAIKNQYEPATADDATVRMTTKQIFNKIFSFYPSEFNPDVIYELMQEANFKYEITGSSMNFYWLLKEKS